VNSEKINAEKMQSYKRLNKNRPREMSSKRPVTTLRQVFSDKKVKKREVVDPRFEAAYGEYEPDFFRKNYAFINDIRKNEKEVALYSDFAISILSTSNSYLRLCKHD
jgi:ribosomal RNA-processing protein 36